jgi:hypothetical protein
VSFDNQHAHAIETRARTESHREGLYREATCETWSKVHTPAKVPEGVEECGLRAAATRASRVGQACLVEPARPPDLTPERERPPELDTDDSPRLRTPARVQHHAQDAVDAEPGVSEASVGVVHFAFPPRGSTVSGRQT